MTGLEAYAREQIATLIPALEDLELNATVSDTSYSVEFFVRLNGERKQCYELANEGLVDEEDVDQVMALIARYIRSHPDYKKGEFNEVEF